MRFSLFAGLAGLSALTGPAAAMSLQSRDALDFTVNDDHKIPGQSPLALCPGPHEKDLVTIESVDLLPNPPRPGKQLVIKAKGEVKQTITKGAYVQITVKYGLIRLISMKADLCDQITNVDLECPLEAGTMEITKSVDLPSVIPPGRYSVLADVHTADGTAVTCLTATIEFPRALRGSEFDDLEL